jgi:hypothetical protein
LAGALLFDKKIRLSVHYCGLVCVMLEFFKFYTQEPFSKEQLLTLLHFWSRFGGKDCGLCQYNPSAEEVGGLDGWYEAAQNFEVFSNIQG